MQTNKTLLWRNVFLLCLIPQCFCKLHLKYKLATLIVFIYTSDTLQKRQGNKEMNHDASGLQGSGTEDLKGSPGLSKTHHLASLLRTWQWWEWSQSWLDFETMWSCMTSSPFLCVQPLAGSNSLSPALQMLEFHPLNTTTCTCIQKLYGKNGCDSTGLLQF